MQRASVLPARPDATILAILVLALVVRLPFFLGSDFPLNDGGLFFVMSEEVAAAHYSLPYVTSYNADRLPFAYPPFSFFLTAFLSQALSIPLITLVRYLPLLANLLAIIPFIVLARSLLRTRDRVFFAAVAFVLVPRSYEWLVMGGGLTRSLGFLFALTALCQAVGLYRRPSAPRIVVAAGLVALTWLTHLEMGLFVSYSYLLLFLSHGRSRRGLLAGAAVGLGAGVLTAPWWLVIARYHGLEPYRAASATAGWSSLGGALTALQQFLFSEQPSLAFLGGLTALGLVACVARRQWLLPLWLLLVFVLTPRSAPTEGTVPAALLMGIGLADVVLAPLPRLAAGRGWIETAAARLRVGLTIPHWEHRVLVGTLAATVSFADLVLPVGSPPHLGNNPLETLPAPEREAMAWIASHTPPASAFLVLSPKTSWEVDYVLEWFPALARRKSVLTVQGSEWLPGWAHARRACLYNRFHAGGMDDLDTMNAWLERMGITYTHVYVSRLAPGPVDLGDLREALLASPGFQVLFDGAGATVFARTGAEPGQGSAAAQSPIARDCQTLFDQPEGIQAAFHDTYGERAPWAWADAHAHEIGP